ncbi:UNVERIFIED_CONTAM: hypothetical protein GTU68_045737 [Idotea baltica]|nr:hypothetical protein [Idotea baltica]
MLERLLKFVIELIF